MSYDVDTIAEKVASYLTQLPTFPWIIRVAGGGSAGKSTFCQRLTSMLAKCNILNTDPYIVSASLRALPERTGEGRLTACHPDAAFLPAIDRDITMLRNRHVVWTIEDFDPSTELDPQIPTIVEGISATFLSQTLFDFSIFLVCDRETEWDRRWKRDVEQRSIPAEKVEADFANRRQQLARYVLQRLKDFQLVLKSEQNFGLTVVDDRMGIIK